jgi:hypothetical protein
MQILLLAAFDRPMNRSCSDHFTLGSFQNEEAYDEIYGLRQL